MPASSRSPNSSRRHMVDDSGSDSEIDGGPMSVLKSLPCPLPVLGGLVCCGLVLSTVIGCIIGVHAGRSGRPQEKMWSAIEEPPTGVNVGGWLVLEDWFFSGFEGTHVMSASPEGQGLCLPPELTELEETWPSEGILVQRLKDSVGVDKTFEIFAAHRHAYVGNTDLRRMRDMGIQKVRVPIPWYAFQDALYDMDPNVYRLDAKVVPDPYWGGKASFVPVDRSWLAQFLRRANGYGLKVVLDIHSMPGGSSDGTYNGVWPLKAMFWLGNATAVNGTGPSTSLTEVGFIIVRKLISWIESLATTDAVAFAAVAGLTVMNEPAHMADINTGDKAFVQSEQQVLDWLAAAADIFRQSTLPGNGVKLYLNVIETAIGDFYKVMPPWFHKTFSKQERDSWVVMDIHWYTAWDPDANGRVSPGGAYFCDQPLDEIRTLLSKFAAQRLGRLNLFDGQKACTEFSVGTFENAVVACNDVDVLRMFLQEQLKVFRRFGIEPFFWTWHMPYGATFQRGWALEYLAGVDRMTPPHACRRKPAAAPKAEV